MEDPRSNAFLDVLPYNLFTDLAAVKKRASPYALEARATAVYL
jgi:hypothetical protein